MSNSLNPRVTEIIDFMVSFIERHTPCFSDHLADAIQAAFPEASALEKTEAVIRFISHGRPWREIEDQVASAIKARRNMH